MVKGCLRRGLPPQKDEPLSAGSLDAQQRTVSPTQLLVQVGGVPHAVILHLDDHVSGAKPRTSGHAVGSDAEDCRSTGGEVFGGPGWERVDIGEANAIQETRWGGQVFSLFGRGRFA